MSTRPKKLVQKKLVQMKRPKKSSKRKKVWACAHREHYYDDFLNVQLCNAPNSGCKECRCKNIFQTNVCPFFEKGKLSWFTKFTKADQESVDEFKSILAREAHDKEVEERALLKRLKEKYEK